MPEWGTGAWIELLAALEPMGPILLAMLLGGAIGFERELADRPAGLRTHMLLAGAAALFFILADELVVHFGNDPYGGLVRTDPIRVVEAVITGVAFLGAGTIFRRGEGAQINGLTTAASMLFTAGIGLACGLHRFVLAIALTGLTVVVLRVVNRAERRWTD